MLDKLEVPARAKRCEAMVGLIEEAQEMMEEIKTPEVLDAVAARTPIRRLVSMADITGAVARIGFISRDPATDLLRQLVGIITDGERRQQDQASNAAPYLSALRHVIPTASSPRLHPQRAGWAGAAAAADRGARPPATS